VFQMSLADPVTTCLSPAVHYMVCKLGFEIEDSHAVHSIVSENGDICWRTITELVHYRESGQCFIMKECTIEQRFCSPCAVDILLQEICFKLAVAAVHVSYRVKYSLLGASGSPRK
uniref:Uncharacterized protein n=1 Tax=Chelonoidis abingdonii TaxID=106734 RepID=A0A8C0GS71_CHEAB